LRSISSIGVEHYAPVELLLPDAGEAVLATLRERFALDVGRPRSADRVLLDSFDGRLREAGLRAEAPVRGSTLTLYEAGAPARRETVRRAPRYLVEELPRGPLRERLAGVLEERALLPAVRVRGTVRPLSVLNRDAKTVVRLELEDAEAVLERGRQVPLASRLTVVPVLGYDKELGQTLRVLRDRLGFTPAERPLFDEAVLAAGGLPEGISTKPKVELARGTRTDEAASVVLLRLLEIAETNLPGTIDDLDAEFLHDLRVSIRRARSVLRELKDVHDPARRRHLRDELKWAQNLTGPVRDLDVQLLEWEELVGLLAPEREPELEPLRELLARRRASELKKLRRGLRSERFHNTLAAWRALAEAPPADDQPNAARPIEEVAAERIRKVYRRMVRDGSRIDDGSPPEDLHDLRKRGKELRYLLELFGSPFPKSVVKPMVSTLKDLQEVLGRFQDRAVQIELLHEVRDQLREPATLMALGSLLDALVADQQAARDAFATTSDHFKGQAIPTP
jgi:CHAD domain-containing protein